MIGSIIFRNICQYLQIEHDKHFECHQAIFSLVFMHVFCTRCIESPYNHSYSGIFALHGIKSSQIYCANMHEQNGYVSKRADLLEKISHLKLPWTQQKMRILLGFASLGA